VGQGPVNGGLGFFHRFSSGFGLPSELNVIERNRPLPHLRLDALNHCVFDVFEFHLRMTLSKRRKPVTERANLFKHLALASVVGFYDNIFCTKFTSEQNTPSPEDLIAWSGDRPTIQEAHEAPTGLGLSPKLGPSCCRANARRRVRLIPG